MLEDSEWLAAQPPVWFQRLYDYLDRQAGRRELESLRHLPIIPIPEAGGNRLYAPSASALPPEESTAQPVSTPGEQRYVDLSGFPQPKRARQFLEKVGLAQPKAPAPESSAPAGPVEKVKEAKELYTPWTPTEQAIAFDPEVAAIVGELRQKLGTVLGDAGRLGEQLACVWLKRSLAAKYGGSVSESDSGFVITQAGRVVAAITWSNKAGEQYLPFDIRVVEGNSEQYYEVKSTTGSAGETFKISMEEWIFARDQGSRAHILLISEAIKEPKIIDIPHPFQRWQQKQLKIERFGLALDLRQAG
jgi:hypothetical protein